MILTELGVQMNALEFELQPFAFQLWENYFPQHKLLFIT